MKNNLILSITLLVILALNAEIAISQTTSAIIKNKHTTFIDFENMPADMPNSVDEFKKLSINGNESVYEKDLDVKVVDNTNENMPRMFRRMREQPSKTTYKNLEKFLTLEQLNVFGKDFLITDTIENIKWKLSAGEQKIVAGYTCMKAMFQDSANNIVVFFTPQIPYKFGPDKYGNLPGVILEVQSANFHIIATEVKKENVSIVIPTKGSKMSKKDFDKLRDEKTKEMREMWGGRGNTRVIRQ